ncbi:MAG: 4Fe-4S dicluster domain-containing protein [Clostridia bacterium]|nr:4Fe-4S dicluster domain-containing protein [Clostridia bacterium]
MAKPIRVIAEKCIGCESCALACSMFKTGTIRPKAAGVVVHIDQFNKVEKPVLCRQCKQPKCVEACLTGSLYQDADGVVLSDKNKCTGCWACVEACPFDAVHRDTIRNIAVKCDLCYGHEAGPRCVTICPVQALTLPVTD